MSDESSKSEGPTESSSESSAESSSLPPADPKEEREARKANARAVGVDTAFLDALGDEFVDAPAPAGRYGPGGTLVAESIDEVEKVTGIPRTKLPPPMSTKKERDEVLRKEFLQESTPTLQLEGDGDVLFESAAVEPSESERLNLLTGAVPVVPRAGELPDVFASFEAKPAKASQSGDALVVSVGPMPEAGELTVDDDAASTDAPAGETDPPTSDEGQDAATKEDAEAGEIEDEAKPAPLPPRKSKVKVEPPPKASKPEAEPKRAAVPIAAAAAASDEPDYGKYAVFAVVALLLVFGGYALLGGDDEEPQGNEVAQAGASGKDKAAPAAGEQGDAGDRGGVAGGGGADGEAKADGAGSAGDEAAPAAADAAAEAGDEPGTAGEETDEVAAAATEGEPAMDAADTEATGSTGELVIDDGGDGGAGGGGGGGVAPLSGNTAKGQERAAEDEMSAKELRQAARAALNKRKYGDAYRLAGKANRKQASEAGHALRVEAACGMKNQSAAKSAFDHIETGKVRRDLRSRCRGHGIRLGI